jgi:hypothetical protein
VVLADIQREKAAKTAYLAKHFRAMSRLEHSGQSRFDLVAEIDINTRARVCLLFHGRGK